MQQQRPQNVSVPTTCKQLNNLQAIPGGTGIGSYAFSVATVVAMIVQVQERDGLKFIDVEDSTGMMSDIEVRDIDVDDQHNFQYVHLTLSLAINNDGEPQYYLKHMEFILNLQQVIEHQCKAYSFYLSHMLTETPRETYKHHLKEKASQQQHQASASNNLAGGIAINFAPMQQNQPSFQNNTGASTVDRITQWIEATHPDTFSPQDLQNDLKINLNELKNALEELCNIGKIYTGTDDNEYHPI